MRWSLKIARIAGIEVRIHFTFFLLLAYVGYAAYAEAGLGSALESMGLLLTLFSCVLLHEFGHAITGRSFGIRTPDITLLPIGGVARMQRMPDEPWQELLVALAGPAVNVVIVVLLFAFTGTMPAIGFVFHLGRPPVSALEWIAAINAMLVLFNLVPAFPMDGGRVLRSLLAMTMRYARATQIAAFVGQMFAFIFGYLALTGHASPLLLFIALFVFLGASQEASAAQLKDLSAGLRVAEAMLTDFSPLHQHTSLEAAGELLARTTQHDFPVVDAAGRVVGVVTRATLVNALRRGGATTTVGDCMHADPPVAHPAETFTEAFQRLQEQQCPTLPVVDDDGRLVGMITPRNLADLALIQSLRQTSVPSEWRAHPPPLPPPLPRG